MQTQPKKTTSISCSHVFASPVAHFSAHTWPQNTARVCFWPSTRVGHYGNTASSASEREQARAYHCSRKGIPLPWPLGHIVRWPRPTPEGVLRWTFEARCTVSSFHAMCPTTEDHYGKKWEIIRPNHKLLYLVRTLLRGGGVCVCMYVCVMVRVHTSFVTEVACQ